MNIYQLFDANENTHYVEAPSGRVAVRFIEESYQTRVTDWTQLFHVPLNTEILVAYERKTKTPAIA
jgi:hypothetical protein